MSNFSMPDDCTVDEATFISEFVEQADDYAPDLVFHRSSDKSISVFYRKDGQGQLNVGVVKLQGKTKYIKINNERIDGETELLLPHINKFIERIENNEKTLAKIEKEHNTLGASLIGKDAWKQLSKR